METIKFQYSGPKFLEDITMTISGNQCELSANLQQI